MAFTSFIVVSGRGAVSTVQKAIKPESQKKVYYGPKNNTDPMIRFTKRERYGFYLSKHYASRPFDFLYHFDKEINRFKATFYIDIFNKLKSKFIASLRKERKLKKCINLNYSTNIYNSLPIVNDSFKDTIQCKFLSKFDKLSFLNPSFLDIKKKNLENKKQFRQLINLCKQKTDIIQVRNLLLLNKLKLKIYLLALTRVKKDLRAVRLESFYDKLEAVKLIPQMFDEDYVEIQPQMDTEQDAHGEDSAPNIERNSNTLNESQRDASIGVPAKRVNKTDKVYAKLSTAEQSPDYGDMTNRYFPHKTYTWTKNQLRNTAIVDLTLPLDFILEHSNSPNCVLFNSYAYWDGDIEVKLMLNSNRFMRGQLQMAWYYGQDYEQNFDRRNNVYIASQQAHCLISAAASNEGSLYIPFRYYKPKMGTKMREDDPGRLNMGRLTVRVLNQLDVPSTTYGECTFTISIRFVNSNFSGMVARDLGKLSLEPQMFSFVMKPAVKAALSMLNEIGQDPERDNPPDITPPMTVVPRSAHSWSVGDQQQEPINPMRLIAPGQTPHPAEVVPQFDEMSIDYVKNIFGLVQVVEWTTEFRTGKLLFSLPGSPIFDLIHYYKQDIQGTAAYAFPPVAVLSHLFAYWRGSLDIRLDAIATFAHTGRLLIACVPRVMSKPTLEQAKSCPHAIFDLQGESRQFFYNIPYMADRPWWHTSSFSKNILPPTNIHCFVLNELIPMDAVSNTVEINIYVRGGADFELSIPVVPRIGLSTYNASVIIPKEDSASSKPGYTPTYVGEWRYVAGGTVKVLRYGNVTDHITQWNNFKKGIIYTPDEKKNGKIIRGEKDSTTWYVTPADVDVSNGYGLYALYFSSLTLAMAYLKGENSGEKYISDSGYFDYIDGTRVTSTIYLRPVSNNTGSFVIIPKNSSDKLIPNMDERVSTQTGGNAVMLPLVPSTGSGMLTFGENFNSLKTLCRRYQLYTHGSFKYTRSETMSQSYKIPLLLQGIPRTDEQLKATSLYNIAREGPIPIIASAYRYARGGMRLRLVWRSTWDCTIRMEVRPDERLTTFETAIPTGHQSVYNDGYAYFVQNTKINNIFEIEIPFYQSGVLAFLQNPKLEDNLESYHFSLGNLYLSFLCIDSQADTKVVFDLYYSLADDCRFSVFQGFPPMIKAPDSEVKLEPQMGIYNTIKEIGQTKKKAASLINKVDHLVDKVDNFIPGPSHEENASNPPVVEPINVENNITAEKEGLMEWISKTIPKQFRALMANGVSQLVHCIINPTIKTICWSLASFLASIGILCSEMLSGFCHTLKRVIEWLQRGANGMSVPATNQTKQSSPIKIVPQMSAYDDSMPSDVKAGLIGTIVASIAASLNVVTRMPKNLPDFTKGVWENIGKFSFTANHLTTFFKNNLTWITNAYKWVLRKTFPKKAIAVELQDMGAEILAFAQEATELLDEANARKCEVHPKWNLRVYACAAHAVVLLQRMSRAENAPRSPALLGIIRQIIKKRDDLTKFVLSPPIRFEPYVLAFSGKSNIGKSHLCQEIGKKLLTKIEYKTFDELIYTRTPGNPYWNQLRNQPICLYDDFIAIGGEHGAQQAAELFCLKSRAIFNPPQAEIENKHIRYNPLLVFLSTNNPFAKIPEVTTPEAFFRRRDNLILVEPNEEFYLSKGLKLSDSPKRFKSAEIKEFQHLLFRIANTVTDPNTTYGDPITYSQLVERVSVEFSDFYIREMELYMKAVKEAYDFFPDDELSTDSVSETLIKMTDGINNINRFRYGNIGELKQMITKIILNVDSDAHSCIPAIIGALKQLQTYDKITVSTILDTNTFVKKAWLKIHNPFVAQMTFEEADATVDEFTEKVKEVYNIAKRVVMNKCPHYNFNAEFAFDRKKTYTRGDTEVHPGMFFDGLDGVYEQGIPDVVCKEKCKWLVSEEMQKDMDAWMNEKYLGQFRQNEYKNRELDKMPKYFIDKAIKEDIDYCGTPGVFKTASETRWNTARKEVRAWVKWAADAIDSIGSKLWSVIKWASKIVVLLSGVFAISGFAYNKVYPEAKACKEAQYMADKGIVYKVAYDGTLGGMDAVNLINAEMLSGNHYTQKLYPSTNQEEAQMVASGDYKTFGKANTANVKDIAIKVVGQLAQEQERSIIRMIKRNTMFIHAEYGTKTLTGRIIGLLDHYAIAVDHYNDKFSKLPDDAKVFILGRNFKLPIKYSDLHYKQFSNSSLGYYKLPIQVAPFKNILKHMAYQKDHRHVGPNSLLVEPQLGSDDTFVTELYCQRIDNVEVEATNGFDAFSIPDGYKYAKGGKGMCGSVLVSSHLEHPIYGIHVAGDTGGRIGISEAITREQFAHLEGAIDDTFEPEMYDEIDNFIKPQTDMMLLGAIQKEFAHRETGISKVIPTECNNEIFPIYCGPPVLSPKDERIAHKPYSPMLAGCNKHGVITQNFPSELVNLAFEDLKRMLLAKVKPVRGEVGKLSKAVAVCGSPHYKGFEKLDFNTSEGFPYTALRPKNCKSKIWMLDLEQLPTGEYEYKGCDDTLKQVLKIKKLQRARRCLPFTVFVDCLKDRKLPIEKITKCGGVRIFSISPLDYTIQVRQYFMDFTTSYQEARLDVEHAVGIDVNSYEWSDMTHRLLQKGNKIVSLDYSGFGPSLNALCAQKAIELIREWYKYNGDRNEEHDLQREMMGYEIIYSVHLMFNVCYRTMCGLPSGGPLTVVQNSLVNCLYLRVSWMLVFSHNLDFKQIELDQLQNFKSNSNNYTSLNGSLESFHKHTEGFVYGDDVILSVSDEACEIYNADTIADALHKYGIIIKNATKSDEIVKYNALLDAETSFLKNNFKPHPYRKFVFLASLDKKSVEDTLNWTFKEWQHKLREISLEASDAAIRSAFGHGPEYYNFVRNKVFSYWLLKGENMATPTWEEIDKRNYG